MAAKVTPYNASTLNPQAVPTHRLDLHGHACLGAVVDELPRGGEDPAVLVRSQQLLVVIPVQGGGVGADTNVREGATSSHHLDLRAPSPQEIHHVTNMLQ